MFYLSPGRVRGILFTCICLFGFNSAKSQLQHTVSYEFPDNLKGYSVAMVSDRTAGTTAEAVMAGTIYNYNGTGRNVVHFIYKGDNGGINASVYFDDPGQADFRAVSVVCDGGTSNAVYTILCQVRPFSGNDHAMWINVDKWGTLLAAGRIIPNVATSGLYPLYAMHHSNGSTYICGYETDNNTAYPAEPNFSGYGHKRAFIHRIGAPAWSNFFTTNYISPLGTPTDDYDIAMRMIEVNNGNVFVTGSVNNCKQDASTGNELFMSGTMNLVVKPLGGMIPVSWDPFGATTGVDVPNASYHEYGVGLVQDQRTKDNYVIGNLFARVPPPGTIFDPRDARFCVTRLDSNFFRTPSTNSSRYMQRTVDYAWALSAFRSVPNPAHPNDLQILIAGLQTQEMCHSTVGRWDDSVAPFLYDVGLSYNGTSIVANFKKWITYRTQTGTGLRTAPNSYWNLGSGISNIFWNPVFASRNSLSDDIVMSAPRVSPASGSYPARLNLKSIRVNNALEDPDCPQSYLDESCISVFTYEKVDELGWPGHKVNTLFYNFPPPVYYAPVTTLVTGNYNYLSQKFCPEDGIVYRDEATGVNQIEQRGSTTKVYPNPANNKIKISLTNSIQDDANISIVLNNIYGQVIAHLYNGNIVGLENYIQLPQVATGVYMVQVFADGKPIHQERLSIQP